MYATSQLAQTTLRSVLGQVELDDLLAERERLNTQLQQILDQHTEPWGVKVASVEVKQVDLPPDMKMKEQEAKLAQLGGEKRDIAFGSQIRNYVLQPYQMVKDLRTREQTGDVNRVLDGDIDQFIKAYLMKKAAGTLSAATDDDVE